ncbi:MAG: TonB-dependent receptor [Bacteroidota bacterium]
MRKISKPGWLMLNLFILYACSSFAQTGIIKGQVKDESAALSAATVSIANNTTFTNSKGEFSIAMNPGTYILVVTYAGYKKFELEIIIKANETQRVLVSMRRVEQLGEVVILGSRSSIQRSNMTTDVPIDVISARQLFTGQTDLTRQLALAVPSFNSFNQTLGNGSIISPAALRGLGPDETLVLINGQRRHTAAVIFSNYNIGYGTAAADLNTIPSAAIENVEILRDGASAQYGSDAIAGVINLQLKKTTGLTTIKMLLGQFYKADGETISLDINRGFSFGKNLPGGRQGFINFTASARFNNYTQRNGIYDSSVYYNMPPATSSQQQKDSVRALDNQLVSARGFDRLNHRRIGNPRIFNTGFVMNGAYSLTQKTNLFWTGIINYRFASDRATPIYRYPKDTTTVINELYPDGFQTKVSSTNADISFIAGIEGETGNEWHWSLSNVYGVNYLKSIVSNTNNATQFALGKNAQTDFRNGNTLFSQNTNTISFTRNFAKYFQHIKSFTVSFGGEFRIDHYQIKEGEEASWKNYSPASGRIGGSQPPGNSPENAVNKSRYIRGAYTELEMDKNENFLFNLAGRYENYSDFGDNLSGKLAMRYKFNDRFMLRGSVSNGFRAPAIQQRYFSAINQIGGRNNFGISVTGTYRNDSEVAAAFGIAPLKAERSLNISTGMTLKLSPRINITLDAYWIQIRNRIILTGTIQRNATVPRVGQILDSLNKREINAVRFFTNAVSTRTKGMDIVITGQWPVHKSVLKISLAANYNQTTIFREAQIAQKLPYDSIYKYTLFNPEERGRLEHSQPRDKIILTADYKTGKWEFGLHCVHLGKVAHINITNDRSRDQFYSPNTLTGISVGYSYKKWIKITAGANNVFNVYPDKLKNRANTQAGLLIYDANSTPIGYNGGYYFLNMTFSF